MINQWLLGAVKQVGTTVKAELGLAWARLCTSRGIVWSVENKAYPRFLVVELVCPSGTRLPPTRYEAELLRLSEHK